MSVLQRGRLYGAAALLALSALIGCSAKPSEPLVPGAISAVSAANFSSVAGVAVASASLPSVKVTTTGGTAVSGVTVSFAVTGGGGSIPTGASAVTNAEGIATVGGWTLGSVAGSNSMTATIPDLSPVTFTATGVAGPAANLAVNAGNNQTAATGAAVATPPSVKVTDAAGNAVSGTVVTYAVASGGGSVTGASATSDASGIATVGSWTLGSSAGTNTLTASASGLAGSLVTFTANASSSVVQVSNVSPATLTSGATATITGVGFSATPASNAVTIDGLSATVTAATSTSLTVTVPTLPCTPAHSASVSVTVGGANGSKSHPVSAPTQRALTVGQSLILSTATEARCNELSNTGGLYYVNVYNSSTTFSTTGASFELKGGPGAASLVANPNVVAPPRRAPRQSFRPATREDLAERAHIELLERNLRFLRQNGRDWRRGATANSLVQGGKTAYAVGDPVSLKIGDLNSTNYCTTFLNVTGRVAFVGTRSIIVEDNANELAGTIDTTYAQIGSEFDSVMWPILETNYGDPLKNDDALDNNDRIIMVFSNKVRTFSGGNLAGFVSPCDFFPTTTWASSNRGEYFYATAPTIPGTISTPATATDVSPPRWRWTMRATIIHEVKHIVSTGERFARNGGATFEESWLEETTARLSEELYERARYTFAQRANLGYGSAANPVGPYCGVRLSCNQARGIVRVFEELGTKWYSAPHDFSPLGRNDAADFAFYATGWSIVRWAIDASANAEATILKGMTQEPTRVGVANFDQYMGTTFAAALPKWTMAMLLDDFPGLTPADATLKQPSWDLRNVFSGYKTDFPNATFAAWPLVPLANTFGTFSRTASVRAGTAAVIELSGTQSAKQLLELKASGSSAAAPAELRMTIVRVQ